MDKRFRYRQKTVQDITCANGLVRVWDAAGDIDRQGISKAFTPLLRTGLVNPYVALMPDHHPGESSMVGSVIPTRDVLLLSVIVIRDYYIDAASGLKKVDQQIYRRIPYLPIECDLAHAYRVDQSFALAFARESRQEMMLRAIAVVAAHNKSLQEAGVDAVAESMMDVAHNYVAQEEHFGEKFFVHRKGAVRALDSSLPPTEEEMAEMKKAVKSMHAACHHGAARFALVVDRSARSRRGSPFLSPVQTLSRSDISTHGPLLGIIHFPSRRIVPGHT